MLGPMLVHLNIRCGNIVYDPKGPIIFGNNPYVSRLAAGHPVPAAVPHARQRNLGGLVFGAFTGVSGKKGNLKKCSRDL